MDLSTKEQFKLYQKLHNKFSKPDYVALETGYTSRLVGREKLLIYCEEFDVLPVLIIDSIWGKGLYVFDKEMGCFVQYSDPEEASKRFPHLKQLIKRFTKRNFLGRFETDGIIVFQVDKETVIDWTVFLREQEYCHIFEMLDNQIEILKDKVIQNILYDSESG